MNPFATRVLLDAQPTSFATHGDIESRLHQTIATLFDIFFEKKIYTAFTFATLSTNLCESIPKVFSKKISTKSRGGGESFGSECSNRELVGAIPRHIRKKNHLRSQRGSDWG